MEIGGKPILWHVLGIYIAQGFSRFLLVTGYLGDAIVDFVAEHAWPEGISVECVDTGVDTPTGGRIAALSDRLVGTRFCVTYADGVADVDLDALMHFHTEHGRLATMTVVRPHLQWGVAEIGNDGASRGFRSRSRAASTGSTAASSASSPARSPTSKPRACSSASRWRGLPPNGELRAHRHEGFWDCMDTYKDAVVLNDLWEAGEAPW